MVGVAVKVTDVPIHTVDVLAESDTDGVTVVVTKIVS